MPIFQTVQALDAEWHSVASVRFISWTSGSGELVMWTEQAGTQFSTGQAVRVIHADYTHTGRIVTETTRYDGQQIAFTVEPLNDADTAAATAAFEEEVPA